MSRAGGINVGRDLAYDPPDTSPIGESRVV